MEPSIDLKDVNPWAVESIYDYQYFCCPECETKWQVKQDFVSHAIDHHPTSILALQHITDGSIDDVEFPMESLEVKTELLEDIKTGNYLEDTLKHESDSDHDSLPLSGNETDIISQNMKDPETVTNEVEKWKCDKCQSMFKSKDQMNLHMKKKHKPLPKRSAPFLCGLCGKTLIGHHNMRRHERDKHGIQNLKFRRVDRTVKIQCLKCDKTFDKAETLNSHIIECLGEEREFQCQNCDKTWANGHALNIHMKADHDAKELFTCDICGKCCTFKNALKTHVKLVHDNIKDHVCHLCGKGFGTAQILKFHIQKIHEKSGKFLCVHCNFRDVTQKGLDRHVNEVHVKAIKYQCQECSYVCYRAHSLKSHIERIHEHIPKPKPFSCNQCDFRTISQAKLDIHCNEVHTKSVKFQCEECNFFCYRKSGLQAHVRNVHLKLKPYPCSSCTDSFVRKKELNKHEPVCPVKLNEKYSR